MEQWRNVWRNGISPAISTTGLEALRRGLTNDDPRLIQFETVVPAPLLHASKWPVEKACALGYCGWQGNGLETVADVQESFERIRFKTDDAMNDPGSVCYFINWFDCTPREEMRRELLIEVQRSLSQRMQEVPS